MPTIAIIGNCHAEKLQQIIEAMAPGVTIPRLDGVHKLTPERRAQYVGACERADWIVTQVIDPAYPIEYVRTAFLRERWPGKVVTFTNLFFNGYDPSFTVPKGADQAQVNGPLGPIHFRPILTAYAAGRTPAQALAAWQGMEGLQDEAIRLFEGSLAEQVRRDAACDVQCAPYIVERHRDLLLCHTVNHPSTAYLLHLAERICAHLALDFQSLDADLVPENYRLSFIGIAPNDFIVERFGLNLGARRVYRGPRAAGAASASMLMQAERLVERYYALYAELWERDGAAMLRGGWPQAR